MESKTDLEKYKEVVERKVGRNVLLFQKLELLLKWILSLNKIEGSVSDLQAIHLNRIKKAQLKTMGQLVGQYSDEVLNYSDIPLDTTDEIVEPYVRFSFHMDSEEDRQISRRQMLSSLVSERNDLVHHFLQRVDIRSAKSREKSLDFLDQQYERLQAEFDKVNREVLSLKEMLSRMDADMIKTWLMSDPTRDA